MSKSSKYTKIPKFNSDINARLTVNRLPAELPGVMATAALESEYSFTPDDVSLPWPVTIYGYDGSTVYCDSSGVGVSDATIFTYIPVVSEYQKGRRGHGDGVFGSA